MAGSTYNYQTTPDVRNRNSNSTSQIAHVKHHPKCLYCDNISLTKAKRKFGLKKQIGLAEATAAISGVIIGRSGSTCRNQEITHIQEA